MVLSQRSGEQKILNELVAIASANLSSILVPLGQGGPSGSVVIHLSEVYGSWAIWPYPAVGSRQFILVPVNLFLKFREYTEPEKTKIRPEIMLLFSLSECSSHLDQAKPLACLGEGVCVGMAEQGRTVVVLSKDHSPSQLQPSSSLPFPYSVVRCLLPSFLTCPSFQIIALRSNPSQLSNWSVSLAKATGRGGTWVHWTCCCTRRKTNEWAVLCSRVGDVFI